MEKWEQSGLLRFSTEFLILYEILEADAPPKVWHYCYFPQIFSRFFPYHYPNNTFTCYGVTLNLQTPLKRLFSLNP